MHRTGRNTVSEEHINRADLPACASCGAPQMVELFTIAPVLHEPGLIVYECPQCGHVDSALQPTTHSETHMNHSITSSAPAEQP